MTQPRIYGEDTPDEESLEFEAEAVEHAAADVSAGLETLAQGILAAYARTVATVSELTVSLSLTLGRSIADRISAFSWVPMVPRLEWVAANARDLGVTRATRALPRLPLRQRAARVDWRVETPVIDVPAADETLRERMRHAARVAATGVRTSADAASVVGTVRDGRRRAEGAARWVANEGINAGTHAVASQLGLRVLWVAERNACLHCLAHAGYAADPRGQGFPPGLTFDPRGSKLPGVLHPPLHPNCRCQIRPYEGEPGAPDRNRSSLDPAARLAAEARRSVVYRWTDHASGIASRRAAETLLAAGADLPKTVEERARRNLRRGGAKRPK